MICHKSFVRHLPLAALLLNLPVYLHAGLYPEMRPPLVIWVENGKAMATIVAQTPEKGSSAAAELNQWIRRMTGVELSVTATLPAAGPRVILGGQAAWDRLGVTPGELGLNEEDYVIRTVGDDLVIAGKSNLATLFGVYALLEHYLDCRWFWPGETGVYAPRRSTLRVGQIEEISRPDMSIRWIMREPACARFNRLNVGLREPDEFNLHGFVHTYTQLVEPLRYWKDHPEFYAELGGKRADPTRKDARVNLCTSNPQVVEALVRRIDEIMAADPSIDMISVDPMDTQQFCQCDDCRKLQDPEAPYEARSSRLVFDFTNRVAERVAERHPKLLIKTIAYHTYLAPPPFAMRDNVVIQFCRFMCHNHSLSEPSCPESAYFNRHLLAWGKVCKSVMLYEYYNKASWCGLPWPIVHMLRRDLPYLRRHGVVGTASQWNQNHANNGLVYYVAAKLLWDSKLDVDALLADFYEKAYAEAAGPMRRYHERLEMSMEQSGLHIAMQQAFGTMYEFFTPELEAALAADLEAARKAVRDPGAAKRVELAARGFHYAALVAAYLRTIARHQEKRENQPRWMAADAGTLRELEDACAPHVTAIKQFLLARENADASPGMGSYEERLLTPKTVVQGWHRRGDRPDQRTKLLDKSQWLQTHAQKLLIGPPERLSLWIYGNDLDWQDAAGPEHAVLARSRDGDNIVVDKIGRKDRNGNRKTLAFILRAIDPSRLDLKPLQLTVENLPGGPTSSTVFAIYLMPDDATTEDEAARLIERDLEAVRCRAAAFVEFGPFGETSRDNVPLKVELAIPGYPEEAFRP